MAIVGARVNRQPVKQSQPDIARLLIPTEFHPNGRIQIDPSTGMVRMPKRNVLYKTKKRVRGVVKEVEENGGHAKADDSVWRIALGGPARYFWKLLRDEMSYRLRGSKSVSAPTLTDEELTEARQFVAFLLDAKSKNESVLPQNFLKTTTGREYDHGVTKRDEFREIDRAFSSWLKKKDGALTDLPQITDAFFLLD